MIKSQETTSKNIKKSEQKKAQTSTKISKYLFFSCALFSIIAVIGIIFFILYESIPAFREIGIINFIFGKTWAPQLTDIPASQKFGVLPMIVGSLAVTFLTILIGGTMGIFIAIFNVRFCPKKLKGILNVIINISSGIPSIVFGFIGITVLIPLLDKISPTSSGKGVLASSIILSIMILPTVTNLTSNSLKAVDENYHHGALALGATKEQSIFKVIVPTAKSGILSALVLGIGRAIGETMAVMMVAGNSAAFVTGFFSNIRTLTINMALEMSYANGIHRNALFATGIVLLVFILIINIVLHRIKNGKQKDSSKFFKLFNFFKSKKNNTQSSTNEVATTANITLSTSSLVTSSANNKSIPLSKNKKPNNINRVNNAVLKNQTFSANISQNNGLAISKTKHHKKHKTRVKKLGINNTKTLPYILKIISLVFTAIAIFVLVYIMLFVFAKGLPHLSFNFLFGKSGNAMVTLRPAFVTTFAIILISLAIALPIGICSSIFLVEYAKQTSKIVKTIRLFIDTLAGFPSIVFGFFGMIFFSDLLGFGYSIIAGSLTMVIIILPTIIRSVEESLLSVPISLKEASYGLGANKLQTILKVCLPTAMPGIISAIILSIGRIVGESAALIYTAGAVYYTPTNILKPGSTFSVMMYLFATEGLYINEAYATASVLIILVIILNIALSLSQRKKRDK